jgi:acyl-coenzyme A thioesterase PaaI-like protein
MKITDLPFNAFVGITISDREGYSLSLPGDPKYTNHLGTVHASALLALAEATSGDYLLNEFTDIGFEVVPVVRRLEAKFRKPASGALYSVAKVDKQQKEDFIATLSTKGRAIFQIEVDVFDSLGTHALAVTNEWFVAKK